MFETATDDATVTIDGREFAAETIIELGEQLLDDDNVAHGRATVDGVTAVDDGDKDSAVYMVAEGWQSNTYVYLENIVSAVWRNSCPSR